MGYIVVDVINALRVLSAFMPEQVSVEFVGTDEVCIADHRLHGTSQTMPLYEAAEKIKEGL